MFVSTGVVNDAPDPTILPAVAASYQVIGSEAVAPKISVPLSHRDADDVIGFAEAVFIVADAAVRMLEQATLNASA